MDRELVFSDKETKGLENSKISLDDHQCSDSAKDAVCEKSTKFFKVKLDENRLNELYFYNMVQWKRMDSVGEKK